MSGQPILTKGKEDIRPDLFYVSYPSSVAQTGLRSHLSSSRSGGSFAPIFSLASRSDLGDHMCQFSKNLTRVSPVIFDSEGLNVTKGVYGYTPRLRLRRSIAAPKRSTRIKPTDIYSWRRKSRRHPHHEETWARLAARASEL
eukprot:894969-Pleurochrysis_carterae.AAC.1